MNRLFSILPELSVVIGGVIMLLAIVRAKKILKLVKGQKFIHYWQTLLWFMIFFVVAYFSLGFMIYSHMRETLIFTVSAIFFFGSVFVYLIVHTGGLTLGVIHKSQDELEAAIEKRTSELQSEVIERKKSEDDFRALADSSPLLIIKINRDIKIQYINQLVEPFKREEIIGQSVYNFIHPSAKGMYEKNLTTVFEKSEIVRFEVQGLRANKELGWYFSTIAPIKGKTEIDSAIILSSDITEQKKTQDQLVETASLLKATFDSAVEGILVVDMNGKITTFNKRFMELWRIPNETLATKDDNKALEFVVSQLKDPQQFLDKVKELYSKPEEDSFDILEFKDERFFERYSMPERRNGVTVGRVWNFIDITKRKKAEQVLKLSQEKYRKIVEEVADVVYSSDYQGHFTYINPACKKLTGYSEDELIGKHFSELVTPEWKKRVSDFYGNQFKNKIRETVFSFQIVTKTGEVKWVEQTVNQFMKGDLIEGYQTICRDINERKMMDAKLTEEIEHNHEYEKQLEVKTKELESSNKDLENFAYIASHDLQEPLRMVTSFLGLLEQNLQGKLEKDPKEFLDFAVDGAKRMKNMIDDLLSYSRIISRKAEFKKINMNQILKDVLLNLSEKIKDNRAEITSDPLPEIIADDIKMTRLFQNLISNAVKFTKKGTDPAIKISCKDQDDSWLFSVKDNGIGIKNENFDKIFIIFHRLHAKDEYPGTGIGLAECKKIVELHKGKIWIEAEEGKGSTFYFTIKKNMELPEITKNN